MTNLLHAFALLVFAALLLSLSGTLRGCGSPRCAERVRAVEVRHVDEREGRLESVQGPAASVLGGLDLDLGVTI